MLIAFAPFNTNAEVSYKTLSGLEIALELRLNDRNSFAFDSLDLIFFRDCFSRPGILVQEWHSSRLQMDQLERRVILKIYAKPLEIQ